MSERPVPSLTNLSVTTHGQYGSVVFNSIYPRFVRPGLAVFFACCQRFVKLGLTIFCTVRFVKPGLTVFLQAVRDL